MFRLKISILILSIASVISVSARTVSVDECRMLAREHYPAVVQYGIIENTRDLTLSAVSRAWLPQIALGARATWQNNVTSLPEQLQQMLSQFGADYPGMKHLQYSTALELNQMIWDGGATADRRAEARAQADVATKSTDLALYEVEGKVQEIYFSILLLNRQIAQLRLTENLLDSTFRKINSLVANGVAMPADAYMAEAQLLTLRQTITSMQSSAKACRSILGLLTGLNPNEIELTEPEESIGRRDPSWQMPQQALFDARIRSLDVSQRMVKSSLMPKISAFASASYGYPGADIFKSMRTGHPDFGVMAGVSLRWEIGAFYNRSERLHRINDQRHLIDIERQIADFNKSMASESIVGEIRALRSAIEHDAKIAELRTKVRQAAESQLANGVIDTTSLLDKITDEQTAILSRNVHIIRLLQQYYLLNHTLNK